MEADRRLPHLQELLSGLDPSQWTHEFRQLVDRTDFRPGPIAHFEETVPWGWIRWSFDSTYSHTVPRPDDAIQGQVWLSGATVIRPGLDRRGRSDVDVATNVRQVAVTSNHLLPETTVRYGGLGGGVGAAAGIGSSALIHPLGLASLALIPVGAGIGMFLRHTKRRRGRGHLAIWTDQQPTNIDVDEALAALAVGQQQLDRIAAHLDAIDHLTAAIDNYRWQLVSDPNPSQEWADTVQSSLEAIADMHATCQQVEQQSHAQRHQARSDAETARRAAWGDLAPHATPGDGIAENVQALNTGLREIYGLDPTDLADPVREEHQGRQEQ